MQPTESRVLVGEEPEMHGVVGIGAGLQLPLLESLAPGQAFDGSARGPIDEFLHASTPECVQWANMIAAEEGLLVGPSSGAAIKVAVDIGKRPEMAGKNIVVLQASSAIRCVRACVLRAACCVLRAACCVLRAACCVRGDPCCLVCPVARVTCHVPLVWSACADLPPRKPTRAAAAAAADADCHDAILRPCCEPGTSRTQCGKKRGLKAKQRCQCRQIWRTSFRCCGGNQRTMFPHRRTKDTPSPPLPSPTHHHDYPGRMTAVGCGKQAWALLV